MMGRGVTNDITAIAAIAALAVSLGACGQEPNGITGLGVEVPFVAALDAGCVADGILADTEAALHVSGYGQSECALSVAADLSVSGSCSDYRGGTVRYLLIEYRLPGPTGAIPYGYLLGYVDLRADALTDGTATVALDGDGIRSLFVAEAAGLDFIINGQLADVAPNADAPLDNGLRWFAEALTGSTDSLFAGRADLDLDSDACSNLQEACSDTLLSAIDGGC